MQQKPFKGVIFARLKIENMSKVSTVELEERKEGKDLYSYQKGAIDKIFTAFEESPEDYHLLYQLPTGGGKTVIFSSHIMQEVKALCDRVIVINKGTILVNQTIEEFSNN